MTKVSRAEYQRVVEENKSLKKDLKVLIMDIHSEHGYDVYMRWRSHFLAEDSMREDMKIILGQIEQQHKK